MNLNDLYEMRDPRDAYERDVANSTSGFGKDSQAYRTDGGANDENHALDQKSSTWYIRLNGKLIKDKSGNPYAFQDKAAANKAALTMQAKLFNKDKEFMLTTNPNDKVAEIVDYDTLNQLASHPMAGPLVAAGGAAIGGAIGGVSRLRSAALKISAVVTASVGTSTKYHAFGGVTSVSFSPTPSANALCP